jgi:simple sugar transport system substrate-binding protein
VPQAAEEKGVQLVAYQSDMRRFAPTAQLAAVTADWSGFMQQRVRALAEGRWTPQPVWGGVKDGMVKLAALRDGLPPALVRELAEREAQLVAGRAGPFVGRLVDQSGRVRQDRGRLDDDAIARMDWFVQGVEGRLP